MLHSLNSSHSSRQAWKQYLIIRITRDLSQRSQTTCNLQVLKLIRTQVQVARGVLQGTDKSSRLEIQSVNIELSNNWLSNSRHTKSFLPPTKKQKILKRGLAFLPWAWTSWSFWTHQLQNRYYAEHLLGPRFCRPNFKFGGFNQLQMGKNSRRADQSIENYECKQKSTEHKEKMVSWPIKI